MTEKVVGDKKAVNPHDEGAENQCVHQRARHDKQAEKGDQRQPALHIAVVHLACARDAGEDKGQQCVLFHRLFPLGGTAADRFCF